MARVDGGDDIEMNSQFLRNSSSRMWPSISDSIQPAAVGLSFSSFRQKHRASMSSGARMKLRILLLEHSRFRSCSCGLQQKCPNTGRGCHNERPFLSRVTTHVWVSVLVNSRSSLDCRTSACMLLAHRKVVRSLRAMIPRTSVHPVARD